MALDIEPEMPIVLCDARSKESAKQVLIALVEHVLMTAAEEPLSRDRVARPAGRSQPRSGIA